MTKFKIEYEMEIDIGALAPLAFAEYLETAEKSHSDWSVWEVSGPDSIKCISIMPKEDK